LQRRLQAASGVKPRLIIHPTDIYLLNASVSGILPHLSALAKRLRAASGVKPRLIIHPTDIYMLNASVRGILPHLSSLAVPFAGCKRG
jgi:hypothetical protein